MKNSTKIGFNRILQDYLCTIVLFKLLRNCKRHKKEGLSFIEWYFNKLST